MGVSLVSAIDLGKMVDPSAMATLERERRPDASGKAAAHYRVVGLARPPLGTSYFAIADRLRDRFASLPLRGSILGVDNTGLGRPVMEIFRKAKIPATLMPVTITASGTATLDKDWGEWHVPKLELVNTLQVVMQGRRITVDPSLPEADALRAELGNFTARITRAGNETFAAKSGQTDDLILAASIAVWLGEHLALDWDGSLGGSGDSKGASAAHPPAGVFRPDGQLGGVSAARPPKGVFRS